MKAFLPESRRAVKVECTTVRKMCVGMAGVAMMMPKYKHAIILHLKAIKMMEHLIRHDLYIKLCALYISSIQCAPVVLGII